MSMNQAAVLSVNQIEAGYGPIKALRGLSLEVFKGETLAIIGANGAGKTSLMRALSGMLPITSGQAHFLNYDIRKISTHELANQGLLHVPEGRGTLQTLTVLDNLRLAWDIQVRGFSFAESVDKVFNLFPRLAERSIQLAGLLSGGEQQMLAIGRALIVQPKVLLLDEPSMGLSPRYTTEVFKVIDMLKKEGMTILLVEQNAKRALALADRAIVMAHGEFTLQGSAHDISRNPQVIENYLGQGAGEKLNGK